MDAKQTLIQQGDVLIFTNVAIPADAKEVNPEFGKFILAKGETTGHAHVIDACSYPGTKLFESPEGLFLQAMTDLVVTHEEHKTVHIKQGNHRIQLVKEVDPFTEEIRSVKD